MNETHFRDRLARAGVTVFTEHPPGESHLSHDEVAFDGQRFANNRDLIPILHLASLARRGDAVVSELLTAFRLVVVDLDNKQYWPVKQESE